MITKEEKKLKKQANLLEEFMELNKLTRDEVHAQIQLKVCTLSSAMRKYVLNFYKD